MTLAECAFGTGGVGLRCRSCAVDASRRAGRSVATLFSESASRVVVSVAREQVAVLLERRGAGVPAREIGTTGTGRISVSINGQSVIDIAVERGRDNLG